MEDVLLIAAGAAVGFVASWGRALIERQTSTSNEIFRQRIDSLNMVWRSFLPARDVFAQKVTKGHVKWLDDSRELALSALNDYRTKVDENQVILPRGVVAVLREIDTYLYEVLGEDEQTPTDYVARLNSYLAALSNEVNRELAKRTYAIDLKLRS